MLLMKFTPALRAAETMSDRLLAFDFQFIVDALIMGINMFILFFALSYLLFNPVKTMLKKRQDKIAADLETAEKGRKDALAMKADYEGKMTRVNQEVEDILSDARKRALKQEEEILARAREEAAAVMARADAEIELEKSKAMDDVKQEIISVASLMAGKAVGASLDASLQDKLIDETLKEIGEKTWQS